MTERRQKVLIIGAGVAGRIVAEVLKNKVDGNLEPVGFIDDDTKKINTVINGLPVLGDRYGIPAIVKKTGSEQIIIAMPSAPCETIRQIVEICHQTKAKLKIQPGFYDLITGKLKVSNIREVQLEDLIGRRSFSLDIKGITGYIKGRTILVTGAGGSIGSEICRQLAGLGPKQLVLLGHGENSIYEVEMELREKFPFAPLVPVIADIRDSRRVDRIFKRHRPAVVFHAAAHKHVPLMESNPEEAVKNNIIGTRIVAEAAHRYNVQVFILVSSDKAVNPTSIMGATKRVAEMLIQWMNETSATRFAAVRFGNVLGSRGSVVPLFKKQISSRGPVTITHPAMKRYFMTVTEAAQLVIQAGALARGGEIFILDMGEPVLILDLVKNLIKLSGYEPEVDIPIQYIGIRKGEKLTESLHYDYEQILPTSHKRIYQVSPVNYNFAALEKMLELFNQEQFQFSEEEIKYHLHRFAGLQRNNEDGVPGV